MRPAAGSGAVQGQLAAGTILLEGVGKRYAKLDEQAMLLRSLLPFARPRRSELWALSDLDLTIEPGETVGVVGRNGSGKTTLLRMLAGVTRPSAGRVRVAGRVAALISVGVGFHPEMSGRENVFVNGMLLGLTKAEIEDRFADIVAFAELADFIDTPVKFYSSGMFMRLGFSVAIHVDPQVLLVDEVLAVGDIAFQLKCLTRMRQLQRAGVTIIMVSHSMAAIRMCPRAVLLRRGRLELDADAETAIARHHQLLTVDAAAGAPKDDPAQLVGGATMVDCRLLGPDGPVGHLRQGTALQLRLRVRFERATDSPQVVFDVLTEDGTLAYELKSAINHGYRTFAPGEEAEIVVAFTPRLGGGTYRLCTAVTSVDGRDVLCADPAGMLVYLPVPTGAGGVADLEAAISVDGHDIGFDQALRIDGGQAPTPPGGEATTRASTGATTPVSGAGGLGRV